jgi:processive 1,2-diacylglycerol beta-glucosyltransferase
MKQIIPVLSAGFGEGHNAAARSVVAAINQGSVGGEAEFHDIFLEAYGEEKARKQRDSYIQVANRFPKLWGCLYAALHTLPLVEISLPFLGPVRRRLFSLLDTIQPRVIISAYPLYNYQIERRWKKSDSTRPYLITVVTDSVSVNRAWHRAYSDVYITPNQATADVMIKQGVPKEKILAYGFPVSDKLASRSSATPSGRPRVLLMLNPGRKDAVQMARALSELEIDLTVTVGKDAEFKGAVEAAVAGRAEVLGWTDRITALMLSSHIVISKAGGATTHECVAAGVPMIISQVIPGQEAGNARLIVDHDAGCLGLTPEAMKTAVAKAFADDYKVWRQWKKNVESLGDAQGATRIAHLVKERLAR